MHRCEGSAPAQSFRTAWTGTGAEAVDRVPRVEVGTGARAQRAVWEREVVNPSRVLLYVAIGTLPLAPGRPQAPPTAGRLARVGPVGQYSSPTWPR